jgi:hypothetical protein
MDILSRTQSGLEIYALKKERGDSFILKRHMNMVRLMGNDNSQARKRCCANSWW